MVTCNIEKLEKEIFDIARLFDNKDAIHLHTQEEDGALAITITPASGESFTQVWQRTVGLDIARDIKYTAKSALYVYLSQKTGISHSWGALTGIRPVRLYTSLCQQLGKDCAEHLMSRQFFVTPDKMQVVRTIQAEQLPFLQDAEDTVSIYVGIPFCKGRCSYCSFYSADIDKSGQLIDAYTDALIDEIQGIVNILKNSKKKLGSVYVGGGTPSAIDRLCLDNILRALGKLPGIQGCEFTVEAGRPDSIDDALINILQTNGVNRISINTQSSCDRILQNVGRGHTFSDVVKAFDTVKGSGLLINTDIISGLPGEDRNGFLRTVSDVYNLKPDNITVHTLALKRGSALAETDYAHGKQKNQTEEAYAFLTERGYKPYYLYRQKNAAANAENIGYTLDGRACIYNIHNMDDTVNIIACGANGISKRIYDNGRIERLCAPKDIATYIDKVNKLIHERALLYADF